jgi:hypothetical protein
MATRLKAAPRPKRKPGKARTAALAIPGASAHVALELFTQGDLRAAAAALRQRALVKRKMDDAERKALEALARNLLELRRRDHSAANMQRVRRLQRLVDHWLKRSAGGVRGGAAKAPARPPGEGKGASRPGEERRRRAGGPSGMPPIITRGGGGGPAGGTLSPVLPVVRRTPHMDVSQERLQPGTRFEISVYADRAEPRPHEVSSDILVAAGATVEVHLVVSEHFSVEGPAVTRMTITDAERSDAERRFTVMVRPANQLRVEVVPSLIALFFHNGRPSGNVTRTVEIDGVAHQPLDARPERIETDDGAPADLTVIITSAAINDGRQFFCTVRSPLLEKYQTGVTGPWNLPQTAEEIVYSYMERFTADAITSSMLLAELQGAGRQLFDAAPEVFRQALWDFIDAGAGLRTIAIVTQEPYMPWELMIPYRRKGGQLQKRDALGTDFLIGRWLSAAGVSPKPRIPLIDSFVVAPTYAPPLSFALAEAAIVVDSFAGEIIAPADFDHITRKLGGQGKTLIHIVCHGEDEETQADLVRNTNPNRRVRNRAQIIRLENGTTLNSTQILGLGDLEAVFQEKRPLVFINACEIGRSTPALVGVGGFAKSFIDLGASAVIAPLWSVKDSFAHEVAKTFYGRLKTEREIPFAEILRDIRRKAYKPGHAEDTYAAYCFYGDPAARR